MKHFTNQMKKKDFNQKIKYNDAFMMLFNIGIFKNRSFPL